jgi:serine/threonine kinase 16
MNIIFGANLHTFSQKGNLQDAINQHFSAKTHFPEREMLRYFKGTCEAVRAMHTYKPAKPALGSSSAPVPSNGELMDHHGDTENDGASIPLVAKQHAEQGEAIFQGDDEDEEEEDDDDDDAGIVPYAHRDLKPAFVFFSISSSGHRLKFSKEMS